MSSLLTPGERPGNWVALGDHQRRIQNLEAIDASGGGEGIQFNSGTYGPLNVGDWLSVETTSATGIHLFAGGSGGILLEATLAGDASLTAYAGLAYLASALGNTLVRSLGGQVDLLADAGPIGLTATAGIEVHAGDPILIHSDNGFIILSALSGTTSSMVQVELGPGNYFSVWDVTPIEQFRVTIQNGAGSVLQVADTSGNLLFKIVNDGTVHLKAGASIIYDL